MMISAYELGGTLFVPASHKDLSSIVSGKKYKDLKSLVIDFEDGLEEAAFNAADARLSQTLLAAGEHSPLLFVRAKNVEHLKTLLALESIDKVAGFILAKFSLVNAEEYLQLFANSSFLLMPSIEGEELFDIVKLQALRAKILAYKERVVLVRFGLEDMLKQLRMRRSCEESLFDIAATASSIGGFIATFKSAGFDVSAGVYPCYGDKEGFVRDVMRDLKEGLVSKTIIHPSQIALLNECYTVEAEVLEEAREIVQSSRKIFAQNGKMAESLSMKNHAQELCLRAEIYGIKTT